MSNISRVSTTNTRSKICVNSQDNWAYLVQSSVKMNKEQKQLHKKTRYNSQITPCTPQSPKTQGFMKKEYEYAKSRNTANMSNTITAMIHRRKGNVTSSLFNKGKHATVDFDNLMVPEARETFFNKRIIGSSYATSRRRPQLQGQLKSAA